MDKRIAEEWCSRLESGKYRQGSGKLRQRSERKDKFCCLGVLCEIAVEKGIVQLYKRATNVFSYGSDTIHLPRKVAKWAGMSEGAKVTYNKQKTDLMTLNDYEGLTFKEIAQVIRETVETL